VGDNDVMQVVAQTTNQIAEGEVLQLMHQHETDISEDQYMAIIGAKTAKLFEAASQMGAILATKDEKLREAAKAFGYQIGCAFQLVDDYLDYAASEKTFGKAVGKDLKEGKMTLPLIYLAKNGTAQQKEMLKAYIKAGQTEYFEALFQAVRKSGALNYVSEKAIFFAKEATGELQKMPKNESMECIKNLCQFIIERNF